MNSNELMQDRYMERMGRLVADAERRVVVAEVALMAERQRVQELEELLAQVAAKGTPETPSDDGQDHLPGT